MTPENHIVLAAGDTVTIEAEEVGGYRATYDQILEEHAQRVAAMFRPSVTPSNDAIHPHLRNLRASLADDAPLLALVELHDALCVLTVRQMIVERAGNRITAGAENIICDRVRQILEAER